jgi:hypothetical protein
MKSGRITLGLLVVTALAVAVGYFVGVALHDQDSAEAAGGPVADPNGVAPDRYVYYPGTEALGPDEIRIIACGTGMPRRRGGVRRPLAGSSSSATATSSSSTWAPGRWPTSCR